MQKDNKMNDLRLSFCEKLRETEREGIENIISLLEAKGFFKAPASTRFHLSREGGLAEHSMNVYDAAMEVRNTMIKFDGSLIEKLPEDSIIIAALLHDVCKTDIYKASRMQRNVSSYWSSAPYYTDYGEFPLGHGEKSVIMLLQNGLKMTDDEMIAIRWHMSAWDLPFHSASQLGNYNKAKQICPLLSVIQCADEFATSIIEKRGTN